MRDRGGGSLDPLARFVGKRLVYASAGDAVRDADRLLEKAVSGKAPVYRGGHAFRTSDWKELGREYYGHLMSGISTCCRLLWRAA